MEPLQIAANWATIFGAPCAVAALIYAGVQLHQSAAVARGQFMLELEKMMTTHDAVHLNLRPTGKWTDDDTGPSTAAEWSAVDDYMGFFEHCELLLRSGSLKFTDFNHLFGYRIHNLMSNAIIVDAKLINERDKWGLFLSLIKRLGFEQNKNAAG